MMGFGIDDDMYMHVFFMGQIAKNVELGDETMAKITARQIAILADALVNEHKRRYDNNYEARQLKEDQPFRMERPKKVPLIRKKKTIKQDA